MKEKELWVIYLQYPELNPEKVTALLDKNDNVKYFLHVGEDGEMEKANEGQRFFETKELADIALDEYRHGLIAKMKDVKDYLIAMENMKYLEDELFAFKESDYLPRRLRRDDNIWMERADFLRSKYDKLLDFVRYGFVNIKGDSFKLSDVKGIKWGKEKAEMRLSDGSVKQTAGQIEYEFISDLFGPNTSDYTYTRLDKHEKDTE